MSIAGSSRAASVPARQQPPFDAVKQVEAGELDVGYYNLGPTNGVPVILLLGWPYDIHSFADVAPLLLREAVA